MVPAGGRLTTMPFYRYRIRYHDGEMNVAEWVNGARRSAGMSQRQLAEKSGIPQPTIARIESGKQMPRADTLDRLLRACGWELDMTLRRGLGEDRSLIKSWLALTPEERAERGAAYGRFADELRRAGRAARRAS
jgi:transcriptional regulator with XRE-family HTH domain